jgi:hypothetical protein
MRPPSHPETNAECSNSDTAGVGRRKVTPGEKLAVAELVRLGKAKPLVLGGSAEGIPSSNSHFFGSDSRARHSMRAGPGVSVSERRARSDAPYPGTHPHNENCWHSRQAGRADHVVGSELDGYEPCRHHKWDEPGYMRDSQQQFSLWTRWVRAPGLQEGRFAGV